MKRRSISHKFDYLCCEVGLYLLQALLYKHVAMFVCKVYVSLVC
ncbi:hypothetical protein KSS87_008361 [Heliosperma pusillum]|nr:hypothetical protein KSS87_008361 [Heliosperma pusillum]